MPFVFISAPRRFAALVGQRSEVIAEADEQGSRSVRLGGETPDDPEDCWSGQVVGAPAMVRAAGSGKPLKRHRLFHRSVNIGAAVGDSFGLHTQCSLACCCLRKRHPRAALSCSSKTGMASCIACLPVLCPGDALNSQRVDRTNIAAWGYRQLPHATALSRNAPAQGISVLIGRFMPSGAWCPLEIGNE